MTFKNQWDLETAMKVLQHPTVDAQTWAEAVEWLLLYGPPSVRKILLDASHTATQIQFPDLHPSTYTDDGQPVYDVAALANALGISEDEVRQIIDHREMDRELLDAFPEGSKTVH